MKYQQRSYQHEKFYAVRLAISNTNTWFYAYGIGIAPALFLKRKDAQTYRDELERQGCTRGKVVSVLVTIAEATKARKARK